MEECAKKDVENIFKNQESDYKARMNPNLLYRLTPDKLTLYQRYLKLFTLGLLVHLVQDAKANYDTLDPETRPSWMEYHAKRKNFRFRHFSITELPLSIFEGYCLYLDDFVTEPWAIFIRNLARSVGLRCIVTNTDAKVANFVEQDYEYH